MKTKLIIVTMATLALLGCGSSKETTVSAEAPAYWTEVSRQKEGTGKITTTYVDVDNHVIVVIQAGTGVAVTQIK